MLIIYTQLYCFRYSFSNVDNFHAIMWFQVFQAIEWFQITNHNKAI